MDPSQQGKLGSTAVTVSRLGLGTNPLGGLFEPIAEDDAVAVVRAAWDAGLALFDTAPVYGYGNAERAVGRGLADVPRDSVTVTTKVGRLLLDDGPSADEDRMVLYEGLQLYRGTPAVRPFWDFSYDGAMRSLEASLDRLGLDSVDALYIHDPDDHVDEAADGCYRAVAALRDQGVIGAIGAGSNSDRALVAMLERCQLDCVLVAGRYSLLDQSALDELLPRCERDGVAVVVGGVYNSGLLCHSDPRRALDASRAPGAIGTWTDSVTFDYTPASAERVEAANRLKEVCDRHSTPLMAAAIQFPLAHPAVASVLMGPRDRAELDQNLDMFRYDVPADLWAELSASGLLGERAPVFA
jgi:D-threo-aldose 1-dehydrogenase